MSEQEEFYIITHLIEDGIANHAEVASAIELEGVSAFDPFGRLIELNKDKKPSQFMSIDKALTIIADHSNRVAYAPLNGEELTFPYDESDHLSHARYVEVRSLTPLVSVYGWRKSKLPDFKSTFIEWCKVNDGTYEANYKPAKQAYVWDFTRALVKLQYGKRADGMDKDDQQLFEDIATDLTPFLKISAETIEEWLTFKIPKPKKKKK